ncbi:MAG: site-specific DNA-methyltransferase [Phycisphaerales bacterium]|nr:MAG: site-specific DNA-methyltransferase [Phycisphaerales bacterium]
MAKKPTTKPKSSSKTARPKKKTVVALTHDEATRRNIPTAEYQPVLDEKLQSPIRVAYERRNRDLDPQLVWRGKDDQDWSDLVVPAPPLFIQEKVHPKALIDDLRRQTEAAEIARKIIERQHQPVEEQFDLFADFNGVPEGDARTEFYQHDAHWSNRMILGDSLQVMASLAEREGLRGRVQCIYLDPPYGIKFNSNFQWSTTSRDVKDGNAAHITREPEQVKAFRDTWRDGIHSYLTYLRDRLTVARDLLTESGSIFVQIGDENVHRIRALMDEVFGVGNFILEIVVQKTGSVAGAFIQSNFDRVLWYARNRESAEGKFRPLLVDRVLGGEGGSGYTKIMTSAVDSRPLTTEERERPNLIEGISKVWRSYPLTSDGFRPSTTIDFDFCGRTFHPGKTSHWKVTVDGLARSARANRVVIDGRQISLRRLFGDDPTVSLGPLWSDVGGASDKVYVVQTNEKVVQRCLLMTTDPGDLVLDPTCGSGTTAYVAEQWGRRWITIDTSRVALALARARIMGARYPFYLLADSKEGQAKESEVTRTAPSTQPTHGNIRHGFVYERVPHITLKSIANNAEIDVIWEKFQQRLEPLRATLNKALGTTWEEWEIPREAPTDDQAKWPREARDAHARWWEQRILRQKEIDASIAAKAEFEYLYDKPFEDKKKVRVAGPFTVESLSPHRTIGVDEDDELIDPIAPKGDDADPIGQDFATIVLENLRAAGVQQAHKEDRIQFSTLTPWPGDYIGAEGRYVEGEGGGGKEKRAGIFIGPEFGTVTRQDLVLAAREAADANFDVLIACAFNYEAHASEFSKLGRIPVLKARMNAELHMGSELKATGKGNLFVIFGEPDIQVLPPLDAPEGAELKDYDAIRVKINGVDVFHPQTGEIRSDGAEGIACWFIDTDYNNESFFVRQAYFLGANDPYKALKTTLKAEVNEEAWKSLHSSTSREFAKPASGKIAVKVINHLGDEVMKVFAVP